MLRMHFPEQFKENMSETVSPMCAISRYLKATHPGCKTVFIGPCIAKKSESHEMGIEGNADYVLTFGEMTTMMASKNVEMKPVVDPYQESSIWGKSFATSGGVANAVMEVMRERNEDTTGIKLRAAAGGKECNVALTLLKLGTETIVDADKPDTNVMSNNNTSSDTETITQLRNRLQQCFEEDKVYLDPKLRLSELAARLGTNRTYLSQYFNHSCAQSFYEYVNE